MKLNRKLKRIEIQHKDNAVKLVLWIDTLGAWGQRKEGAYAFKWDGKQVFFMFGGWNGKPEFLGYATTQEEAQREAEKHLHIDS